MKVIIIALAVIISAYIIRPHKTVDQINSEYINQITLLQEEARLAHEREIEKLELQVEIEKINAEKPVELREAELKTEKAIGVAREITSSIVGFLFVVMVLGLSYRFSYPFKKKS